MLHQCDSRCASAYHGFETDLVVTCVALAYNEVKDTDTKL